MQMDEGDSRLLALVTERIICFRFVEKACEHALAEEARSAGPKSKSAAFHLKPEGAGVPLTATYLLHLA
jgi:hypothetical protein